MLLHLYTLYMRNNPCKHLCGGVQAYNIDTYSCIHTYIHTHISTYRHKLIFTHTKICVVCRSHIAVSGTTLPEEQRFNLIQFSNGGKIIKL